MLNPILGLILVIISRDNKATMRIVSVVAVEVVISGTIMMIQFLRGKTFYNKEFWKYALGFNLPLIPHYLSGTILNQGDRIMIEYIVGLSEVGIYSLAYSIGMLVQLFTNAINNAIIPWMYSNLNNKNFKNIRNNINYILLFISFCIIGVLFFVPELVRVFGSEEYYNAIYIVPPVACSVFFIFLYNIFAIPQMYYEKQKMMAFASIVAALTNIILNAIFIPIFGYFAAGYTTVICYMIYSLGHFVFSRNVCIQEIGSYELFDGKTIFIISCAVFALSIIFNFLYTYYILRYIIAVIAIIVFLFNYKFFINVIKKIKNKN